MPGRTLPTLAVKEVQSHNTEKSCYVTIGTKVFDVTSFANNHPGGSELILEYGGQDVKEIMADEYSHAHSESAYDILDEYLIGFVANEKVVDIATESNHPADIIPLPPTASGKEELQQNGVAEGLPTRKPVYASTGMSSADDLSKDTDPNNDYKTHQFLDLNKPLFMQVWRGGFTKEFYLEQVHRPRHYKGGDSAPLFGNFLEPLSKTHWAVIPTIWLPPVAYGTWLGIQHIDTPLRAASYWFLGLFLWTFVEYVLHRCLFHAEKVGVTAHFLLHGIHHYLPMDKYRLVMPPTLFVVLAIPFYNLAHTVFSYDWYVAVMVFSGGIFGYITYDLTHYFLHHRNLPSYYRELKKYHLQHHFAYYENGFGVSNRFWDKVFGTELKPLRPLKAA